MHAASVTITSADRDTYVPSENSATAVTVCDVARRIRVDILACPARGPRRAITTSGCGFFSVKSAIDLTRSDADIGLSTDTITGTLLPFSTIAAMSRCTLLPACTGLPPVYFWRAAFIASEVCARDEAETSATSGSDADASSSERRATDAGDAGNDAPIAAGSNRPFMQSSRKERSSR